MLERFSLIYITTFYFIGTYAIFSLDSLYRIEQTHSFGIYIKFLKNKQLRINFFDFIFIFKNFKYYQIMFVL